MRNIIILIIIFFSFFIYSCEEIQPSTERENLVNYFKEIKRKDLADIVKGYGFRAGIVYKDQKGNYQLLTRRNCYYAIERDYKNKEFAKDFCDYLLNVALRKVLNKRLKDLDPEVKELLINHSLYYSTLAERNLEIIHLLKKIGKYIVITIIALIIGLFTYIIYTKEILKVYRQEEKKAMEKIKEIYKKKENIEKEIEKQKKELERLQEEMNEKTILYEQLEAIINDKKQEINELNNQLEELKKELEKQNIDKTKNKQKKKQIKAKEIDNIEDLFDEV